MTSRIVVRPALPSRWADIERLFGERGACGGCWCMTPRLPRAVYERSKGEKNRRALKKLVDASAAPGLIAYRGREPVGWCALGPREEFSLLARSRILKPVDERPVWSLVCFFVAKAHRGCGVQRALIRGAVVHARRHGAAFVEAYPVEPAQHRMPDVFAYTGVAAAFRREGFTEVARRSPTRPIMRLELGAVETVTAPARARSPGAPSRRSGSPRRAAGRRRGPRGPGT